MTANVSKTSLKRNFMFRLIYDLISLAIPIITTPYVTRMLGPDGCGIYSYTQANVTYFVLFAVLGTYGYGLRTISRSRDDQKECSRLFWEIELLTVVSSLVSLMAFGVFLCIVNEYRTYYFVLSVMIISALLDISWFYTGLEQIGYITWVNVFVKILGTICIFTFVKKPDDLLVYFLINVCITFVSNMAMWLFLPRYLVKVSPKSFKIFRHLKETLVYFVPTIAISIYTVLDKTLIGVITHEIAQNGYYDKATQLINIMKTVVFTSMATVMGARTSYLFAENRFQEVKDKIALSMNYIMFMAIGCGFGILAVADGFIPLFLGERFVGSIKLLKLMTPLIAIVGISNCLGSLYYNPIGKRHISSRFIITGAIINLIFNILLIPKFGAIGATLGTLIAETTISVLYVVFSDGYLTFSRLFTLSYKKLIAGITMLVVVAYIGALSINTYLKIAVQIVCGVGIYVSILGLLKDEIVILAKNSILKKFNK